MSEERYSESFSRNLGIVTPEEQNKLKNAHVAIAGAGGAGGNVLYALVRAGVRNFTIAEPDPFQCSDINRQFGASTETLGRNKAEVLAEMMPIIDPDVNIRAFPEGVNEDNVDSFLEDADVVVDAIEYFFSKIRSVLMNKARRQGLYVFFPPSLGFGCTLAVFSPEGPTMEEFYGKPPEKMSYEYIMSFGEKLFPVLPEYLNAGEYVKAMQGARSIPTFGPTVIMAAAVTAIDVALYLTGRQKPVCVPKIKWIDACQGMAQVIDTEGHKWSQETKKRLFLA